jgi:hypothetical protein
MRVIGSHDIFTRLRDSGVIGSRVTAIASPS